MLGSLTQVDNGAALRSEYTPAIAVIPKVPMTTPIGRTPLNDVTGTRSNLFVDRDGHAPATFHHFGELLEIQ